MVWQYQDVSFQQETWFNGDADARLAVALDVTANREDGEEKNTVGMTDRSTWFCCLTDFDSNSHIVRLQGGAGATRGISVLHDQRAGRVGSKGGEH